jgi:hypothetical protein
MFLGLAIYVLGPLQLVQVLLGHSSVRTTSLYLHVTARRLAEVHSPLDLIGSGDIER